MTEHYNILNRSDLPGPPNHARSFDTPIPLPSVPGDPDFIPEENVI
jgi:hypothetical protein